jgi:hypothetical protein
VRKLLLLLPPVEVKYEGRLSLLSRRRAAPVVALRPGLEIGILLDVGVEMLRLRLRLRAFVTLQGILLVALAHAQIVFTSHPIVTLKNPKAAICFRHNNNNNNNNNNNSSLIKMLLLHVSATVTNRLIPTVLNVLPTISVAMQHPGFYCTGPCGRWIHPKCAGYEFHAGPDGGEEGAFLLSTFYYPNNMIIPLSASQGEQHPLYCIKCWEHQKRVQAEDTVPPAFGSLSHEEKVLRLGIVVAPDSSNGILNRRVNNRSHLLLRHVGIDMLESLKDSSPRPYPTTKPMSESCHANHARYGRVFETSMLCFEIKKCDCCGISIPFNDGCTGLLLQGSSSHTKKSQLWNIGGAKNSNELYLFYMRLILFPVKF